MAAAASYLLDTNVISELRKARSGRAHANVIRWAEHVDAASLHLSVVTIEEIETGIARCERRDPAQATLLRIWLEHSVLKAFAGRILAVDVHVARSSGRSNAPDRRPHGDRLIAATARLHGMTVVTRNVADFEGFDVPVLDPWG